MCQLWANLSLGLLLLLQHCSIPPPQMKLLLLHTSPTLISFVIFLNFCVFFFFLQKEIPHRGWVTWLLIASPPLNCKPECRRSLCAAAPCMFYVTFTGALCWGNWALNERAEKWHLLCWFVFLSFFAGINLVASVSGLLSLCWGHCQINFMLLLPKQPWRMCDFFACVKLAVVWFHGRKRGGRSERYPEITNSPPLWLPFRFKVVLVCSEPRHVHVTDIPHLKGWKGLACRLCCKGWSQRPVWNILWPVFFFQKAYSKIPRDNSTKINIYINTLHEKHPTNKKS